MKSLSVLLTEAEALGLVELVLAALDDSGPGVNDEAIRAARAILHVLGQAQREPELPLAPPPSKKPRGPYKPRKPRQTAMPDAVNHGETRTQAEERNREGGAGQ